jgi:stage II sporulation protein D
VLEDGLMRRQFTLLLLCLTLAMQPLALGAQKKGDKDKSSKPKPPPTSIVGPVRLVARGNDRTSVAGLHSFFDTVKIGSAGNGLFVVNQLPLERYVLGLNEVPPKWPMEALRAQATAARTYALHTLSQPPQGDAAAYGYDICATIECQVFSGADVVALDQGYRWVQAVQSTKGQTILYGGRPILARYSSASGGRTFDNEDAFPTERAYPYLQSVPSPWETGSPLYRWEVTFTIDDMQTLLARGGWWSVAAKGKLKGARTVPSNGPTPYPDIIFRGKKGSLRRFGDDFRTLARDLAPGIFPGRYPTPDPDLPSGTHPETLPSERFRVVTKGNVIHFYGRGWGHGTGMTQWGAHGLAKLGRGYQDILRHYYSGVTINKTNYRGPIEVGVATGLSNVSATGRFKIINGNGKVVVPNAFGTWGFSSTGGSTIAVTPGEIGPAPKKKDKKVPLSDESLSVSIVKAPKVVPVGGSAFLLIDLSREARVSTVTAAAGEFDDLNVELKDGGPSKVVWLAPLEPGTYTVRVQAEAGSLVRKSKPVTVRVRNTGGPPPENPVALPADNSGATGTSKPLTAAALALLLIVGSLVVAGTIRGWPKQRASSNR